MASKLRSVKLAAMHRVQLVAIEMFETDGFDAVSVADIADAAGVAPRSVYRYFGTKEGIITWNEADDDFVSDVVGHVADLGLRDALREAIAAVDRELTAEQRDRASRQVALIDETPQLRAHMAATIEEAGRQLGAVVAASRDRSVDDTQSRLDATVAVTALFSATFAWERANSTRPLSHALGEAIDSLETWATR